MKKNIVSVALAVCMIGTTVPVAAADFSDVPAVENNSEFSDGNATDTCDSYTDVNFIKLRKVKMVKQNQWMENCIQLKYLTNTLVVPM